MWSRKRVKVMTLTPDDDLNETARQRTRDQFALLREAHPDIIVDSDDDADFTFVCHRQRVLVNTDDVAALQEYLNGRVDNPEDDAFAEPGDLDAEQPRDGLFARYLLPDRRDGLGGDRGLLVTLDEIDRDLGLGFARPDHLVHICPRGSQCPATEPEETGLDGPWPAPNPDPDAGQGVTVVVIDGGWYDPRTDQERAAGELLPWEWMRDVDGEPEQSDVFDPQTNVIRPYAGHGTFIAGIIQAAAPACRVHVLSLPVDRSSPGGGVWESDMVAQLDAALTFEPSIINLSAGCATRLDLPARSFENWWADVSAANPERDLVFVAAAGNNASPWPFWPASFEWAVGVGSLDRDGTVSDFSNWGDSVDVFALGRNIVSAFPNGTYVCNEAPDRGDVREFGNWLARWSGTSFAAPLVAGRIAATMSATPRLTARAAQAGVLGNQPTTSRSLTATTAPVVGGELILTRTPMRAQR